MHDVLIVGGGPAGLAFARSLAGTGLDIAIIERQSHAALADPAPDGREIALTHRSVATLKQLGAWSLIAPEEVAPLREAKVYNGRSRFALSFDPKGGSEAELGYLVPNHYIRRALFTAVEEQPKLHFYTETAMRSVRTGRDHAQVMLTDGRTLRARLLVAADSRFSAVRDQLGIAAEINRLGKSMLVCRVEHPLDHHGIATEWFGYDQTIAMLPLNGRMSSAVLTLPTAQIERLMAADSGTLSEELTQRFEGRLGAMRVVGEPHAYPLATTWSHHFAAERAALIGDAAVGMHPVTAHGFNLGLQSQAVLAGLIVRAAAHGRDIAAPMLLRRYEMRHRLASRPLYTATNMLVGLYTDHHPAARLVRRRVLRAGAHLPFVRNTVSRMLMQPGRAPRLSRPNPGRELS
ncbi:5-demethoxyubiquinol-8 5-hydroxylase UbiM [Stakelama sediminis]|uniref:Ubiquinone biosynthesis UbiH/UbiF/VisC/COQ6 family hydroxylase n=1 Tax=Stakelama sediminis TaxID=463200 RepID=A0A840YW83_9SPHN|nr:5-demethoxyubiquinol-8 5-hydroxylase UbiM [Stakelama sediminis]MBB5717796.1 ubiquinone biosynthesis UbiH/UbiF/VisC/COQ6 family hydroxylase [Stakelama sediminis]